MKLKEKRLYKPGGRGQSRAALRHCWEKSQGKRLKPWRGEETLSSYQGNQKPVVAGPQAPGGFLRYARPRVSGRLGAGAAVGHLAAWVPSSSL